MTTTEIAKTYIETAWGSDGGAAEATAEQGLAMADLADLHEQYGEDAEAIGAEIVRLCRERAGVDRFLA